MTADEKYIFGTSEPELARLEFQHRLWSDVSVSQWARAGFGLGDTILDAGCGPGFASRDLAQLIGPSGKVIAADRSEASLDLLRSFITARATTNAAHHTATIEVRGGELDKLTLPPASLDGAHFRWVLTFFEHLDEIFDVVHTALRPGGKIAILDYLNWPGLTWGPRAETLPSIRRAVLATFEDFGSDGEVARRIPAALHSAGFDRVELRPIVRIATPTDALWRWPETWLRGFLPTIIEHGHITPEGADAWSREWAANTKDPAGFFMTPPMLDVVATRPA